jgi:hypothetical protein
VGRLRLAIALLVVLGGLAVLTKPEPLHSQGVEVFLNVTKGGSAKLGIAIPEFTRLTSTPDEGNFARVVPEIIEGGEHDETSEGQ